MTNIVYRSIRNALVFFFFANVFSGIQLGRGGDEVVISQIIVSLIFGIVIGLIPNILKFFKIQVTVMTSILLALVLIFIFFFVMYAGYLGLGTIEGSVITLISGTVVRLDALETLLVSTIVLALSTIWLDWLGEQAK